MGHIINLGVLVFRSRNIRKFFQNFFLLLILFLLDLLLILRFFHPLLVWSFQFFFLLLLFYFVLDNLLLMMHSVGFCGIFANNLVTIIVFFILDLRMVVERPGNFDGRHFDHFRLGHESYEGRND